MLGDTPLILWGQVFFVFAVSAAVGLIARPVINRCKQIEKNPAWAKTLCSALYIPLPWLIWGTGFFLALEIFLETADLLISGETVVTLRNIFWILFATWIALSWKRGYEQVLKKRVRKKESKVEDEVLIMAVSRVLSACILIVAALALLEIFEIPLTALLAFGGVGGVAIGFAGKDIVANFFGGLMVHINRPFSLGERIRSPNKNFEGIVEEIGWYTTRLRTLDRKPTYIPNAFFIDAMIENFSRVYNQRIKQTIGIRYQDVKKIEPIVEEIRSMLRKHPDIDQDKVLFVHFVNFGPSALEIEIICFTKTKDRGKMRDIQQEVFLKIANIIDSHGAEIAFPTCTVHLEESGLPPLPQKS